MQKIVRGGNAPSFFFLAKPTFQTKQVFYQFVKEGICPNIGGRKCSESVYLNSNILTINILTVIF